MLFKITTANSQGAFDYDEETKKVTILSKNPVILFNGNCMKVLPLTKFIPNYEYTFVSDTIEEYAIGEYEAKEKASTYLRLHDDNPYISKHGEYLNINIVHSETDPRVRVMLLKGTKTLFDKVIKAHELEDAELYCCFKATAKIDKDYECFITREGNSDYLAILQDDGTYDDGISVKAGFGVKKFYQEIMTKLIAGNSLEMNMLIYQFLREPTEFVKYFISDSIRRNGVNVYQVTCLNKDNPYEDKVEDTFENYQDAVKAVKKFFYGTENPKDTEEE